MEKTKRKGYIVKFFLGNLVLFNIILTVILVFILFIKSWKFSYLQQEKLIEVENQRGTITVSIENRQFKEVLKRLKKTSRERDKKAKELDKIENHLSELGDYYQQCEKNELFKTYASGNSAMLVDLNNDGKEEVISWGSDIFLKPGVRNRDLSGIRIYSAKGENSKLVKVFEKKTMTRSLSVEVADLDCNGTKEILIRHHNGCLSNYGGESIIYYRAGAFNYCSKTRISAYPAKYQDVDNDGKTEIIANIHFPKGAYHTGEIEFPMLYQWDKNRIIEAPKKVKAYYYNNIFIPKLKREIAGLESEDNDSKWRSREIEFRKRAIPVAQDLMKGNFVRDPGWRSPAD